MITFVTSLKTEKILYIKYMCVDGYIYRHFHGNIYTVKV